VIPEMYRTGHEANFAEVTRRFLAYRNDPSTLPAWETDNLRAKYYLTTHGVRLARAFGLSIPSTRHPTQGRHTNRTTRALPALAA
jgi:hypothetical protein